MPYILRFDPGAGIIGANDINLTVEDSWSPVVSTTGNDVIETMPIAIHGNSDDNQAASLRELHRLQDSVLFFNEETSAGIGSIVWLVWQTEGETNARRRLVKSLDIAFDNSLWFTCGHGEVASELRVILTMRVAPWWEATTSNFYTQSGLYPTGDTFNYGAPGGDAPGRVDEIRLSGHVYTGATDLVKFWYGFRSERKHGGIANFITRWEIEDGAGGTDTAAVTEAGASPDMSANNCLETTFATDATMIKRGYVILDNVTANYTDNYGRFVVLLRAKVDAATTATARIDYAIYENVAIIDGTLLEGQFLTFSNTSWQMYDTGLVVQIPAGNARIQDAVDVARLCGFNLYARRDVGAGSLFLDCLILIPIDEYFMHWESTVPFTGTPTADGRFHIYVAPDDTDGFIYAELGLAQIMSVEPATIEGLGLPYTDSIVCVAAVDYQDRNVVNNSLQINLTAYERYKSLRGAG